MYKIYFATNRKPNNKTRTSDFGSEFSVDGLSNLRFGVAEVGEKRQIEKLSVYRERLISNKSKSDIDTNKSILGSQQVFSELREDMQYSCRDVVIFIHGYNVTFKEAILSAADLTRRYRGVANHRGINVALFSWPSDGSIFPWLAYASDRRDSAASGPAFGRGILKLADFLQSITVEEACNQRLHLIAHSMGNYVLRHALQEIIRQKGNSLPKIFDQIILVAADEDSDAFEYEYKLKLLPKIGKNVHVYFNRNDAAMLFLIKQKEIQTD